EFRGRLGRPVVRLSGAPPRPPSPVKTTVSAQRKRGVVGVTDYGRGRSSYSVRLVRKDLDQLQRSLPAVAGVAGASVADLRSVLAGADPIQPFTHALLDAMRARLAEVSWPEEVT